MANAVTVSFDNPDPEDCPQTFGESVTLLNELVSAELQAEIIPYITGAATPDVDDQDKIWHRVDANGRPLGTYHFYNGNWRRQYTAGVGMVVMYSGDPAVDFSEAGHRGTIGGQWDGWNLCTGENGTPNLSDKFIVGAKMDDLSIGYPNGDGPWKTNVTGETTQEGAGVHEITLTEDNTYRPERATTKVARWEADGNTQNIAGNLYGTGTSVDLVAGDAGNTDPDPIPTLPPHYALAFAVFLGFE